MIRFHGMGDKLNAKEIIQALELKYSARHTCFAEVKDGPTWARGGAHRRMDFVAIKGTWNPITIKAFEVKVSRADFLNDQKWPEYLDLCNQFYWVCPKGLIKREEIDPRCGLVYINPKSMRPTTVRAAVYRDVEPEPLLLLYLIICRHNPSKERQIDIIKREMKENKAVGKCYATYVSKKLAAADEMVRSEIENVPATVMAVTDWMKENGVSAWGSTSILDVAKELNNYGTIKKKINEASQFLAKLSKCMDKFK